MHLQEAATASKPLQPKLGGFVTKFGRRLSMYLHQDLNCVGRCAGREIYELGTSTATMGFEVDNLSLLLLGVATALILLHSVLLRAPDSVLHPIVLGRQGESAKVRKQRESAVYTNSNASQGMLVARAQTGVKTVRDLVSSSASRTPDAVKRSVALFAKALVHFLRSSEEGDARHLVVMTGDDAATGMSLQSLPNARN